MCRREPLGSLRFQVVQMGGLERSPNVAEVSAETHDVSDVLERGDARQDFGPTGVPPNGDQVASREQRAPGPVARNGSWVNVYEVTRFAFAVSPELTGGVEVRPQDEVGTLHLRKVVEADLDDFSREHFVETRVYLRPQALALEWREGLQVLRALLLRAGRLADRLPQTGLVGLRLREGCDAPGVCVLESLRQLPRGRDLILGEVLPGQVVSLEPCLRRHQVCGWDFLPLRRCDELEHDAAPLASVVRQAKSHAACEHFPHSCRILEAVLESQHRLRAVASKHTVEVVAEPLVALAADLRCQRDHVAVKEAQGLRDNVFPREPERWVSALAVDAGPH